MNYCLAYFCDIYKVPMSAPNNSWGSQYMSKPGMSTMPSSHKLGLEF